MVSQEIHDINMQIEDNPLSNRNISIKIISKTHLKISRQELFYRSLSRQAFQNYSNPHNEEILKYIYIISMFIRLYRTNPSLQPLSHCQAKNLILLSKIFCYRIILILILILIYYISR